eukprot:6795424-Lingulodinium_polyedra.AAC.1
MAPQRESRHAGGSRANNKPLLLGQSLTGYGCGSPRRRGNAGNALILLDPPRASSGSIASACNAIPPNLGST